jgi:hypothetical protein
MSEVEKLHSNANVELMKVCTGEDYDCDDIRCDECEHFLGESTWIKEYVKEVLLDGESVLPYICENNTNYKERCKNCCYLTEKDKEWFCDSQYKYCKDIEYCHEV